MIVIAAAAMSHLRALRSSPDWMPSNGVSTISCFTPSSLATRSTRSTSKPTILPPCSNWNGSYGRWVQVVSAPSLIEVDVRPAAAGRGFVVVLAAAAHGQHGDHRHPRQEPDSHGASRFGNATHYGNAALPACGPASTELAGPEKAGESVTGTA